MNKEKSLGFFVLTMAGLGILALLNSLLLKNTGVSGFVTLILYIIGIILLIRGGRSSKMADNGHPAGRGALMGAVYGIIAGISFFFMESYSAQDFQTEAGGVSAADAQNIADVINSTGMHTLIYIIYVLFIALFGLIISAIGGATMKKPRN